ncbi:hypothetical protein IC582_031734 [Cucumis melo]
MGTKYFSRDLLQITSMAIEIVSISMKVPDPSGSIRTLSYCSREMTRSGPVLERSFYGIPIYQNFDFWFRRTNNH